MIGTGILLVENHVSTGSRGQKKIILNDILRINSRFSTDLFLFVSFHLPFDCN